MKQLIEEQKKLPKLICDLVWSVTDGGTKIKESQLLSYQDEPVREYEDILNWHKQSLKQFIDGLIEETKKLIVNRPESLIKLNAHLDSRTQQHQYSRAVGYCEAVDKGVAHLKKLKEELN